ncbi:hypothetical protein SLA2020_493380 [Shorea laevis]
MLYFPYLMVYCVLGTFLFIFNSRNFHRVDKIRLRRKTIAARRSDVRTIIFPSANRRDFDELAANVKEGLDVHFVDDYGQIFDLAFGYDQNTGK